jgi:hypothetical protein
LEAHWTSILTETVTQASIDEFFDSIDLGPCLITNACLSSKAHLYFPWIYKILDVIERKLFIKQPKAQTYASKAYIFRNLKEVSIIPCQSELSVLLINWIYDRWLKVLLYQKKCLMAYASQYRLR